MKPQIRKKHSFLFAVTALVTTSFATTALHAQTTQTWRGDGNQAFPNAIWGGIANWVGNQVANGANNTALFGTTFNNGYSCHFNVTRTLGFITFTDPDTVNTQNLIIRFNNTGDNTTLTLSATGQPAFTVTDADNTLIFQPRILGTQGFAKNGPGRLVLSSPNSTYTGPLNVNGGILDIGGGVFTVTKGTDARETSPATLDFDVGTAGRVGNGNYAGAITIAEDALIYYNSDSDTTLTGNITGAGALHKGRSGLLTLTGANTYTGGTTSFGGFLSAVSPGSLPGHDAPGKVVFDGGTIGVRVGGGDWSSADVDTLLANATRSAGALGIDTTNGDFTPGAAYDATSLGPALGLTKLGSNTLTLNLVNNFNGPAIVRQGTLLLAGAGTLGNGDNSLNLEGGTLDLGGKSLGFGAVNVTRATTSGPTIANGSLSGGSYAVSNPSDNALISANLLASGASGLTKTGAGTVTLAGANTYTGDTEINAGALLGGSGGSSVSDVVVATGAAFGPLVTATNGQWVSTGDLTYGDNSTILIDFGTATPSKTVAPIRVVNLDLGSGLAATIPASALGGLEAGESYPIITWTGSGPADASAITSFLAYRTSGNFSVVGNALVLSITAIAPGPIAWNTGNGTWDQATANWLDAASLPTTYFDALDDVVFGNVSPVDVGDPITVTLDSAFSPASVTVNSTDHDYTISGPGSLGGSGGITVGIPNTRVFTLGMNNTFTGGLAIQSGTVRPLTNQSLGPNNSVITVANGAMLDFNAAQTASRDYHAFVTGNGVNGAGAVINTNTGLLAGLGKLTLQGNASIGGTARWDVRPITAPNGQVNLGGFNLTKVGSNKIAIVDSVMGEAGMIDINAGILGFTRCTVSGAGSVNVNNGATLEFENYTSGSFNKAIQLNGGLINTYGTSAFTTASPITLSGSSTIQNTVAFTLNGVISGDGALAKTQTGVLTLNAENTYSGATTISAGQITLGATGSIADSASITINAGATLNTVNKATYAIPAGQAITFVVNPAGAGSSGRIQAAGLNVSNATVAFDLLGTLDDPVYVLATYTSLSGSPFASVTPPPGYSINYSYEGDKIALIEAPDDYAAWALKFPSADLSDPDADFDGDGLTNNQERIFGLDPTDPSSVNPIVVPFDASAGTLSFTRRDPALTGYDYSVWTSTNLAAWTKDTGAVLTPGAAVDDVETVAVQLSAALLSEPKLFVRIGAEIPPPLFFADFEDDDGGFTVSTASGTAWQYGVPNSPNPPQGAVTTANSGTKCWATNLTGGYGANTNTSLRSPVIDLTGVTAASLSYALAIDAALGHTLEVNVIEAASNTVIANVIPATGDADISSAPWLPIGPVALPGGAFGQPVRLEWRFIGNGDGEFNGAYIDDVLLTEG